MESNLPSPGMFRDVSCLNSLLFVLLCFCLKYALLSMLSHILFFGLEVCTHFEHRNKVGVLKVHLQHFFLSKRNFLFFLCDTHMLKDPVEIVRYSSNLAGLFLNDTYQAQIYYK